MPSLSDHLRPLAPVLCWYITEVSAYLIQAAHVGGNLIGSLIPDYFLGIYLVQENTHLNTPGIWNPPCSHGHWASVALLCYCKKLQPGLWTPLSRMSQGAGYELPHWDKHWAGNGIAASLITYRPVDEGCFWYLIYTDREGRKGSCQIVFEQHLLQCKFLLHTYAGVSSGLDCKVLFQNSHDCLAKNLNYDKWVSIYTSVLRT